MQPRWHHAPRPPGLSRLAAAPEGPLRRCASTYFIFGKHSPLRTRRTPAFLLRTLLLDVSRGSDVPLPVRAFHVLTCSRCILIRCA